MKTQHTTGSFSVAGTVWSAGKLKTQELAKPPDFHLADCKKYHSNWMPLFLCLCRTCRWKEQLDILGNAYSIRFLAESLVLFKPIVSLQLVDELVHSV